MEPSPVDRALVGAAPNSSAATALRRGGGAKRRSGPEGASRPDPTSPISGSLAQDRGSRLRELTWLTATVADLFLASDFLLRADGAGRGSFVTTVAPVGNSLASALQGIASPDAPRVGQADDWPRVLAVIVYTVAAVLVARCFMLTLGRTQKSRP